MASETAVAMADIDEVGVYASAESKNSMMKIPPEDRDSEGTESPSSIASGFNTPPKHFQNPFIGSVDHWKRTFLAEPEQVVSSIMQVMEMVGEKPFEAAPIGTQNDIAKMVATGIDAHAQLSRSPRAEPRINLLYYDYHCACGPDDENCPLNVLLSSSRHRWKRMILSRYHSLTQSEVIETFYNDDLKKPGSIERVRAVISRDIYPRFDEYINGKKLAIAAEDAAAAVPFLIEPVTPPVSPVPLPSTPLEASPLNAVRPKPLSRRLSFYDPLPDRVGEDASPIRGPSDSKRARYV